MKLSSLARWATALAVGAATLAAVPSTAQADPAGTGVVINEIYPNGGSGGGTYKQRYFELYNPGPTAVSVDGWSLQGRSATGTGNFNTKTDLGAKTIASGGYLLVSGPGPNPATGTKDLPTPDVVGTQVNVAAGGGQVALSRTTALLTGDKATVLANTNLVDLVGYGPSTTTFEGATAGPLGSAANGITRNATHVDTDNNGADFTAQPASPCNSAGCPTVDPGPDPTPLAATIPEIQGTGTASPLLTRTVTTRGIVTAVYETGGLNGGFIQTPGTGGSVDPATRTTSDGLFVFSTAFAAGVDLGDTVEVTGTVSEFNQMTQVTTAADRFTVLPDAAAVTPAEVSFPLTTSQKESLEGMLLLPQGDYTITNNFATNSFGEIGLAPGDEPFQTPTNVVAPGAPAAALAAENAEKLITLDDAASLSFLNAANKATPLPWLTDEEVRTGQKITFDGPVVLDFRNSLWKLQPQQQVVAGGTGPVEFGPSTRADGPEPVGGTVKIGTFNVLNYFPTTGEEYTATAGNLCTYNLDRDDNRITTNQCGNPSSGSGNGPRGAATAVSLARQQAKIVKAINTLDADVVSLEEIENSVKLGKDRDAAVATLVTALNTAAGTTKWAFTESPTSLPPIGEQDVIRTAFIYQVDTVVPVGAGQVLVGDPAFVNARQPYAHAFKPVGGTSASTFVVVVNHFKSKSSGSGADADQNDGQGASNDSRKKQATSLVAFADTFADAAGTDKVFLTGDFNAYNKEDPIGIIEAAGYVNVPAELTDKETYQFDGAVGSLDHVFASDAVFDSVTGADIWNVNSFESVAREYSRFNYNVSPLVDVDSPFRASDHDPELVGVQLPLANPGTVSADAPATIRLGQQLDVDVTVPGATGSVTITEGETTLATGTLGEGGTVTLPVEDLGVGSHTLTVSYGGDDATEPSTTTVTVTVVKQLADLAATVGSTAYGSTTVRVTGGPAASGPVFVFEGGSVVGMGNLVGGAATVTLSRTLAVGPHALTVAYGGNGLVDPDDVDLDLTVVKAASSLVVTTVTSKIVVKKTLANAYVAVKAAGYVVEGGSVQVFQGSTRLGYGTVVGGRAKVSMKAFTTTGARTLTVKFFGNNQTLPSQKQFRVNVVGK